jgi:hypothetical protein
MASHDFAGLGLVKANLNRLARLPSQVARPAADAINAELRRQAAAGTDPYGRPHAPLKRPRRSGRSGPPLVDSGASYGQTEAKPLGGAGVGITLGGALRWHMRPGKGRVARRVLPAGAFPPAWQKAIEAAALRVAAQRGA